MSSSSSCVPSVNNSLLSSQDRVVLDGDARDVVQEKLTYLVTILLAQKVIDGTISRTVDALDERVLRSCNSVKEDRKRRRSGRDGMSNDEDDEEVRRTEVKLEMMHRETDRLKAQLLGEVKDLWLANMKKSNRLPTKRVKAFCDPTAEHDHDHENDDDDSNNNDNNSNDNSSSSTKSLKDPINLISRKWFAQPLSKRQRQQQQQSDDNTIIAKNIYRASSYGKAPKCVPKVNMFAKINEGVAASRGAGKPTIEIGYEMAPASELTFSLARDDARLIVADSCTAEQAKDKKKGEEQQQRSREGASDDVGIDGEGEDSCDARWCPSAHFSGVPRPGHRMAVHRSLISAIRNPAAAAALAEPPSRDVDDDEWLHCRFVRRVKLTGNEALKNQVNWRKYSKNSSNNNNSGGLGVYMCEPVGVRLRLDASGDVVDMSYPSPLCRIVFSKLDHTLAAAAGRDAVAVEEAQMERSVASDAMLKLLAADENADGDDDAVELMTMSLYEDPEDSTVASALKGILIASSSELPPRCSNGESVSDVAIVAEDVAAASAPAAADAEAYVALKEGRVNLREDTEADLLEMNHYFLHTMRRARAELVIETEGGGYEPIAADYDVAAGGGGDLESILEGCIDDPSFALEPPEVTIVASADRLVRAGDMWRVELKNVYIKLPQHDIVASRCAVRASM